MNFLEIFGKAGLETRKNWLNYEDKLNLGHFPPVSTNSLLQKNELTECQPSQNLNCYFFIHQKSTL